MKKIALNYIYLSKRHAGGKDQVGLNLLKGFYDIGVSNRMMVLCYDYSVDLIKKIAPDIEIYQIKSNRFSSEFMRLLCQTYVNTVIIPKVVKKERIDCIFHLALNNGFKKLSCKVIVLPHDIKQIAHRKIGRLKVPMYKYLIYKVMYYLDFKHADKIIAISDCDKADMYKCYPKWTDKVKRIYNPIVSTQQGYKDSILDVPYILAVNLQFIHKNIITLLRAYEKIKDKIVHKLVLIGNVPSRVEFLVDYVKEHNLEDKVIFTGFVKDEELYRWMINADLYVNPTIFEGFGMTAVEAIIYKVPTLISKIPVNYETTCGLCDYYFPPDDENELAKKILECCKRTKDEKKLSAASKQLYHRYHYMHIAKLYWNLFFNI